MRRLTLSDLSEITLKEFNELKVEFGEFMDINLTDNEKEVLKEYQEMSSQPCLYSRDYFKFVLGDDTDLENYFVKLKSQVDEIHSRLFYEMSDDMCANFVVLELWLIDQQK